ncbi:MAG: flagellar hook-associated protein FlgL [Gammaproteobacteria bacterium]|nr:flagellar hook-associated protein FlgL [Gammaproteobacteria bacterium]MDH3448358.1 flagellar hook-associated protein FlgL [Gammaproteobacteria bacterium]
MRISTRQIYTQGVEAFQQQQQKLARLQQQISTGVRLSKPSDDPAAASKVLELEQSVSANLQYQANINLAERRLSQQDTVLASYANVLNRVRELALQANNAPVDAVARRAIAAEIDERLNELVSLANTTDANGDFLFAGYQNGSAPFTPATTGSRDHVTFNGDGGVRAIQINENRQIDTDIPGLQIFMEISSALALREIPAAGNVGSGVIAPASVVDATSYVPGDYEIRFTAPGVYDVFDVTLGANIVSGAGYTDSQDIDFQGVRTSITGTPAAGDVFTISAGQYQDVFSIVASLSENLKSGPTDAARAANIAQTLSGLDNALETSLDARTIIGGRLNALDSARDENDAQILVTRSTLSTLRDTDLAEAISQLTLEQTTLDAAQAVFARITSSSLFNFLK